ncbi:MAG: hypothetical protein RL185_880 [Bacteroidota bacterium]|jgi:hypothetical protein
MKQLKLWVITCGLMLGTVGETIAQETLPPVTVTSLNYKYLKSVADPNAAQKVNLLERKAATYNVKESDYYEDEFEQYYVSFYLPKGQVLATYDKNGKVLRTAERFSNVVLPTMVRTAVTETYPEWTIAKDVYLVNYHAGSNHLSKVYKMVLENGDKRKRVKTDEKGNFMD